MQQTVHDLYDLLSPMMMEETMACTHPLMSVKIESIV